MLAEFGYEGRKLASASRLVPPATVLLRYRFRPVTGSRPT